MDLKTKILEFLYRQVSKNNINQIRKGMCEEFEEFILAVLAEQETKNAATRMSSAQEEVIKKTV